MKDRLPVIILIIAISAYLLMFGTLAIRQHQAFETGALDLGNYDQAMWNAAHGRGLALTTLPNISLNRMGLHVEPILYLLVPLYWLWANPIVLLALQTLALGLAAWPLFLLARRRLHNDWASLAVAGAYLLLPATQAVNLFDFHAVALSPFFMLWALYFLDVALEKAYPGGGFWPRKTEGGGNSRGGVAFLPAALFFILAMATKEDVSLTVFMIGLYLMLIRRHWRVGGVIAVAGLLWAGVAFGVVIPAHRIGGEQSAYVKYFADLGDTPLEIALSPFTQPQAVFKLIFRPENIAALGMLTLPFALLGWLGLPVLAISAPSLAISLLSNNPLQQQLETWHYAAPMLAFVSLAAVDGLARLSGWLSGGRKRSVLPLLVATLVVVSLGYHYLRGYSVLGKPFRWPQVTAHHQIGNALAKTISPTAKVVAQAELVPRVSQREEVSIWHGELPAEADVVFMDVAHPNFINQDNANVNFASTMVFEDYGITASNDGYLILENGAPRVPFQEGFQNFLFAGDEWKDRPPLAQFGGEIALVGQEIHLNREAEPQMTLYFKALRQPEEVYFIRMYLINEAGEVEGATVFQQPNLVWWPTDLWKPGDVIKVRFNTLPWWTGDGEHQRFSYAVAIASQTGEVDDPWNEALRLPVQSEQALPGNLVFLQEFYRLAGMVYAQ